MPLRPFLLPILRSLLLLPVAMAGTGCLGPSEAADGSVVHASPVDLKAEGGQGASGLGSLRFLAGFALTSSDARFGGLSGLWLAQGGDLMLAVSDRGTLWRAELVHDASGRLVGMGGWQPLVLARLDGDRGGDAEELAGDGRGGLVVAYEGTHRLRRFDLDDLAAAPVALPVPEALAADPGNSGMEAVVGLADGSLLALSEGLSAEDGGALGWLIGDAGIEPLSYVAARGFVPTGADRQGEGLYVIERRFSWLGGFGSRIVRLSVDEVGPGAALRGEELARLERPSVSDNFEAIAARASPDGGTLLYVLSDDNFNPLQQTLLLQFSLDPPSARAAGERVGAPHHRAVGQQQQARHGRLGGEVADRPGDPG
jgi:hypothetical protein